MAWQAFPVLHIEQIEMWSKGMFLKPEIKSHLRWLVDTVDQLKFQLKPCTAIQMQLRNPNEQPNKPGDDKGKSIQTMHCH